MASIIKVQNLRKVYRVGKEKVVALDDICLEIGEGEMCCIVGASGSGKSTLLNQLAGLEKPTKGRVLIGMGKKQREKLARKELKKMGLLSRANHKPTEMSGGQQQRVGIARAFVAKPKVIFADEPTGNLDSTTSRQVLYSMLEMAKSYGITFVMVTHEKELAYCGDRIVTIKDGRVLDNVLLGEDEKAENRRRLFGDVTSGDIAEPETTVAEEKKPAARQAKAVAAAVAEKVNQESM